MANSQNIPKCSRDGINTRYSQAIYDPSKTHGSNFFLMLANRIAHFENRILNVGDNSERQDNEKVTERSSYTGDETDERSQEMRHVKYDHEKSWRKYLKKIGRKVKKRSNAFANKYIKRGQTYAMGNKYFGRIIKRNRCDYFVFNVAKAKLAKSKNKYNVGKGAGDKKVALVEREWFAAQYAKHFGKAPQMADEVVVLESLMKKTKFRYIGASKYFTNKIVQDADNVVTLTWGSAPRMTKCLCPLHECICLGNSLLPPEDVPKASLMYFIPIVRQLLTWFTPRGDPSGLLVPDLIKSASLEQKLYILLEEKKLLKSFGPEMCLYGCRSFYYYGESSVSVARLHRMTQLRQAIIDGSERPMRADTIIDRLKDEDPRIKEPSMVPSIKAKSIHPVEEVPPPPPPPEEKEEEVVETVEEEQEEEVEVEEEEEEEEEEEMEPPRERICDFRGKCTVYSQVERGADGEFEISYPYEIKFPSTMTSLSGTKLDLCSIYAGLKTGASRLENLIPSRVQRMKKRWYDKWKKEFYLSVFQYPEKPCPGPSEDTKGTQTDEVLKSCLKLQDTTDQTDPDEVGTTSGEPPKIIKCRCDESPSKTSRTSVVSYVASKQSLHKTHQEPKGTAEQVQKVTPGAKTEPTSEPPRTASKSPSTSPMHKDLPVKESIVPEKDVHDSTDTPDKVSKVMSGAKTEPTSSSPQSTAIKSPNTSSIQKGLPAKDPLVLEKDPDHLTDTTSKVPKKLFIPCSSAPNPDTEPIADTSKRPKKAVSLDEKPKRAKTGFFSRSKKSVEMKKKSKTDQLTKNEAPQTKAIKSILRSPNVVSRNPSGLKLEKQSRDELSREQLIKEILLEPQTLPQHIRAQSKTSISSKGKQSDATELTALNEKEPNSTTTQSKTSGS